MTELAALRWGDVHHFQFPQQVAGPFSAASKQLVHGTWHVPMSWNVILVAVPAIASTDNASYTVNWLFTLGGGQSTMGEIPLFTMGPFTKAATALQQQQQLVPSQSLQIRAQITGTTDGGAHPLSDILVGAFVAPNNAEPFGERELARRMFERDGEPPELRDMPMGFDDSGMLHYKR